MEAALDKSSLPLETTADQQPEKVTDSQCNEPASRAAVDNRDIITSISGRSTCFDREAVQAYAGLCKAAVRESKVMIEGCDEAINQCQTLGEEPAHQRYLLRRQLVKNILNRTNQDNDSVIQEILKSGRTNKELKERHVKLSSAAEQWRAKHVLNKLLTRVAWLNLDYIRALQLGLESKAVNDKSADIAFQRQLALLKVNGNLVRSHLDEALTCKEAELGAEEEMVVTELVAVMQALPY